MKGLTKSFFFILFFSLGFSFFYGQSNLEKLNKEYPISKDAIELKFKYFFPKEDLENKDIFFWDAKHFNIDKNANIYVADSRHNKIFCFDSNGKYLFQYGRQGQGPGEFNRPYNIAFFKNHIVIYDNGNSRIQFFNTQGKFVKSIKLFKTYVDFFINKEGKIYAALLPSPVNKHLIDVLSEDGHYLFSFGDPPDQDDPDVNFPLLEGNNDEEIYVAFWFLPIVRKYSAEGELLKEIRIDHKLARENYDFNLKAKARRKPGMPTMRKSVVEELRIFDSDVFLLLGNGSFTDLTWPRKEILKYDSDLNVGNQYWFLLNNPQSTNEFAVAKDGNSYVFYILQTNPKNRIEVFGRK
jgi:hypothetical protein